jgi:hypothetical protein
MVLLPMVVCPVIVVVMLENRVARRVHCDEDVACKLIRVTSLVSLPYMIWFIIILRNIPSLSLDL